ncbi:MAG: GH3 auxin-responsive promoter family protein [Pseudomonadota bacterium]
MARKLDPTPLVRQLALRRTAALRTADPVAAQRRVLDRLVRHARSTAFGRYHRFDRITGVDAYQAAVPLRRYEDFWRAYWQPGFPCLDNVTWPGRVPFFGVTSGTTSGRTKYVPLTAAGLRQNRRAAFDMLATHLADRPKSRLFGGRSFVLGGSTALVQEGHGVWSGDLSGIVAKTAPSWMRPFTFPPNDIGLLGDWDVKLEAMIEAVDGLTITSLAGVPSWVLILFDRLAAAYGRWPLEDLELYVTGGVRFEPYAARLEPHLARSSAVVREVYPASEGFVAYQDRGLGEGLVLSFDTGLFFEFVPLAEVDDAQPTRHWLGNLETDVDYAIVVTSPNGLWSYVVGDVVRFVDRDPPRLLITGRTAYMLSAFGEHLIQSELDDAIGAAVAASGAELGEYVVGPVLPEHAGGLGHHLVFVEPTVAANLDPRKLADELDRGLAELNDDYRAHRAGGIGMAAPEVVVLQPGACAAWLRRLGRHGGQSKVPRVIADPERFRAAAEDLRQGDQSVGGFA